ncbi:MAG: tetratricopeptide repeat protein [Magnetococcus sp. YQC-3]
MKKILPLPVYLFLLGGLLVLPLLGHADSSRKTGITLITGPEASDLLRALGEPLQRAASIKPGDVRFHVMLDNRLNAVALPGQNIILNSGLLLAVRDRDELAAVMAHEIGHLSAGHHIQLESTLKDVALRTMVTFAAGIAAAAATGNGQLAQAAVMGGSAASQSSLLDTMREKESQADRLAIHYLATAGFNPRGMVHFMERLHREQRLNNLPPPYLLTHPLSSQRLMESQQQIDGLPTPTIDRVAAPTNQRRDPPTRSDKAGEHGEGDNMLLARVQAVLEAGTSDDINGVIARFRKRLELDSDQLPARYGLAVAERYTGQLQAAITDLEALLKQHPHDPYLLRERGMVRLELGKPDAAEEDFRTALQYQAKQTNADLLYRLAFAMNEQEKLADASRILRPLTLEHPLVAEYLYLLGVVEGKQNHLGASHLALARYHYLIMEKKMARWHYKKAMQEFASADAGKNIARDELTRLEQLDKNFLRQEQSPEP